MLAACRKLCRLEDRKRGGEREINMIVFHSSNRRSLDLGNGNVAQRVHGFDCGRSRRVLNSSFLNRGRPSPGPFTLPVLQIQ